MKTRDTKQLEKRIGEIRAKIAAIGDIRPGSLTKQSRTTNGEPYGDYWQLSYTLKGRGRTDYVPANALNRIRREIENCRRLRELVDDWLELSVELSKSRIQHSRKRV